MKYKFENFKDRQIEVIVGHGIISSIVGCLGAFVSYRSYKLLFNYMTPYLDKKIFILMWILIALSYGIFSYSSFYINMKDDFELIKNSIKSKDKFASDMELKFLDEYLEVFDGKVLNKIYYKNIVDLKKEMNLKDEYINEVKIEVQRTINLDLYNSDIEYKSVFFKINKVKKIETISISIRNCEKITELYEELRRRIENRL